MLKSHNNLLEPRPSDRLRIGERIVDIPLREIAPVAGGDAVRVTLKSLSVLLALVANANKLVSREALLEWVWPDTLPTDDVVTQAITQLRKALGDDRDHPRYIETLAKQGYRLIAPVEWLVDEVQTSALPEPAASSDWRHWRWPLLVLLLVLASTAAAFWLWHNRDAPPSSADAPAAGAASELLQQYQRIASSPANEQRPSLSPDGSLVVYVRNAMDGEYSQLMLQTASATPPRPLTEAVPKRYDISPTWSPDGRQIAFVRTTETDCAVMLIPATGGSAQELGECIAGSGHAVRWFPDSKALVGAGREAGSSAAGTLTLHRMSLEEGRWVRIPYDKAPSDEDMAPQVSPDGRWIAFQRNISLGDLWRIPAAGGKPQRLTELRSNLFGLVWLPDSRHVLFSRLVDGDSIFSKLDVETGRIVDFRGDENSLMYPSLAKNAVAFEVEHVRSRMRRVAPLGGAVAMSGSERLFESSGSNLLPSVAPDGSQVLFLSDRSGDPRLWWLDSLRSFEGLLPVPRHPPMWRADSQRALVIGRRAGDTSESIYELEPARGRVSKLPVPAGQPVHVAYHPDPDRLLVTADRGAGRLGTTLYDRSRQPWRALATVEDVAVAIPDVRNRRIVLASMSQEKISSADLDLKNPRSIDRTTIRRRNRALVATAQGVRVMDSVPGCYWQWRLVAVEGSDRDARCLGDIDWHLEGVTASPDGASLYLSVVEEMQSDIGLAPISAFTGESR
jgi:DNA-binding winged helix-turn-helix (wHTH) protein/Tol biopolymer transport system component